MHEYEAMLYTIICPPEAPRITVFVRNIVFFFWCGGGGHHIFTHPLSSVLRRHRYQTLPRFASISDGQEASPEHRQHLRPIFLNVYLRFPFFKYYLIILDYQYTKFNVPT